MVNAPKQNTFAKDSSQSLPITFGPRMAGGTKSFGRGNHTSGGAMGNGGGTDALGLGQVLLIPCLSLFMRPFVVAGLGLRYFSINFLLRLGHPLRNPFCTVLSNVKILGLHNNWCANFTPFAQVLTECMNVARFTPGWSCGASSCMG